MDSKIPTFYTLTLSDFEKRFLSSSIRHLRWFGRENEENVARMRNVVQLAFLPLTLYRNPKDCRTAKQNGPPNESSTSSEINVISDCSNLIFSEAYISTPIFYIKYY